MEKKRSIKWKHKNDECKVVALPEGMKAVPLYEGLTEHQLDLLTNNLFLRKHNVDIILAESDEDYIHLINSWYILRNRLSIINSNITGDLRNGL